MQVQGSLSGLAFETGYDILRDRGTAVVGMSPGNSYFKQGLIQELLRFASNSFSQVKVMIPDLPAIHTYKAIGYAAQKAESKTRLAGNSLRNRSQKTIDDLNLRNISIIDWKNEIDSREEFQQQLQQMEELYRENVLFTQEVRDSTREVIEEKLKADILLTTAIGEGVNFLLKELAFLSVSARLMGTDRVAYIYHDRWEIFENFVAGKFDHKPKMDLGFVIVN